MAIFETRKVQNGIAHESRIHRSPRCFKKLTRHVYYLYPRQRPLARYADSKIIILDQREWQKWKRPSLRIAWLPTKRALFHWCFFSPSLSLVGSPGSRSHLRQCYVELYPTDVCGKPPSDIFMAGTASTSVNADGLCGPRTLRYLVTSLQPTNAVEIRFPFEIRDIRISNRRSFSGFIQ